MNKFRNLIAKRWVVNLLIALHRQPVSTPFMGVRAGKTTHGVLVAE
jgi:hypothetical protein